MNKLDAVIAIAAGALCVAGVGYLVHEKVKFNEVISLNAEIMVLGKKIEDELNPNKKISMALQMLKLQKKVWIIEGQKLPDNLDEVMKGMEEAAR